jgi:hypothetical protein
MLSSADIAALDPGERETLEAIEAAYGKKLSQAEFRYVCQDREMAPYLGSSYLTDCQVGLITPATVAEHLHEVFSETGPVESVDLSFNRMVVTSTIMGLEAAAISQVQEFRAELLKNRLIPMGKVESWVKRIAKKDGKPTLWVDGVALPETVQRRVVSGTVRLTVDLNIKRAGRVRGLELHYWIESAAVDRSVYVTVGGTLDRLRVLTENLSHRYGWTEGHATTFVLTGRTIPVEAIEAKASSHQSILANRVILEIDPTSTPKEVVEAYQWAKDRFFEPASKRMRNTLKVQVLAMFYAQHDDMVPKKDRLQLWNKHCEEDANWDASWAYDETLIGIDNFRRDLKAAYNKYLVGRTTKRGSA